jgi:uncharacterized protein (TIGR02145 family)
MKNITLTLLIGLIGALITIAQSPQAFKYQTVVRDNSGDLIINQVVSFRIGILQGDIYGTIVYSEIHNTTTNQTGLVSFEIGSGTVESGVFNNINWALYSHFLKVEMDVNGGVSYQLMGISQLLSVPYSLNASSLTLTDENGNSYQITVDTLGHLQTHLITSEWQQCGDQLLDIDGNTYNTVLIGDQCWMKENLKTTVYSNGTPIPNVEDQTAWSNLTIGAYVWSDNDISWKDSYGALYNWYTTVDTSGLCPSGWHVASNDEWTVLTDYIGGEVSPHGDELKSCRQENSPLGGDCNTNEHPRWNEDDTYYGTDIYGFSGLPGSYRTNNGTFINIGNSGYWWSSTEYSTNNAWNRKLSSYMGYIDRFWTYKRSGRSVRCLHD